MNGGGWWSPRGTVSADSSGNYTVTDLDAGEYQVKVKAPEAANLLSESTTVTVASAATTSGVNFALGAAGQVTGTVTNGSKVAISGASVAVERQEGPAGIGVVASTTTNGSGVYTLKGLGGGSYRLAVSAPGYEPATR